MTAPIIVLGCAFWDTILQVETLPSGGGKLLATQAVQAASGMATAAAVTIAGLGGSVDLWTRIGSDPNGDSFLHDLAAEGLSTAHVRRIPGGRTWFSTIVVDAAGERLVLPFADPGLDPDPSWLPLAEVARAGAVLTDTRWPQGAERVLTEARRRGVVTALDADVAPLDTLHRLMPLADHLLFSEPALCAVAGGCDEAALRRTAARCPDAVVLAATLGAAGAIVLERENGRVAHVPAPVVTARDTLNAGDVWHGTYVYGLVAGWSLAERVRRANVAAAMKCERFGGRLGAPDLAALMTRASS